MLQTIPIIASRQKQISTDIQNYLGVLSFVTEVTRYYYYLILTYTFFSEQFVF